MFSVYLAAPYSTKDVIMQYANELRAVGVAVTSSWLEEPHAPNTQMAELTDEVHEKYAIRDVEDIDAADAFVLFTDPTKAVVRQGRTFEFGYAVAKGKTIVIVGTEHENIFHYLPGLYRFPNWTAAKFALRQKNRELLWR